MAIFPAVNCPIDCGLVTTSEFSRQFTKQTIANRSFDLNFLIENRQLEAGGTNTILFGDINYTRTTFPLSGTDCRVAVETRPTKNAQVDSIVSGNQSILRQSSTDPAFFEYQSSGVTEITVTLNTNEKATKKVTTSSQQQTESDVFISFEDESASKHIFDQTTALLNNSTSPPSHYPLYSTFDFTNNIFVKNTNHWTGQLNFSGLMVNKSGSGGVTMVTAITPHHAIGVSHYFPQVNDTIVFCDENNQTFTRQVVSGVGIEDLWCVRFNEALPSTVKKYKLLPSNYSDYFPLNRNFRLFNGSIQQDRLQYLPVIVCSHYRWDSNWPLQRPNRYAYLHHSDRRQAQYWVSYASPTYPVTGPSINVANYNGDPSNIRGGDSGGPSFLIINNELILIACHQVAGGPNNSTVGGSFLADYIAQIQEAINQLGPSGQTIQTVDLSGFTDFSS
jgi:hypothetical protein